MLPEMSRGDLLQVDWVDIYDNCVGDPRQAHLARRTSFGLFWELKDDSGVPSLVTTTTIDKDPGQEGFVIYPLGCLVGVKVVKRVPKKRLRGGRRKESPQSSDDIRAISSPAAKGDSPQDSNPQDPLVSSHSPRREL